MRRLLIPALLAIAACDDDAAPPVDFAFCAEQHVEGALQRCTRGHADGPRVRLPPDDALVDGAVLTLHAAFDPIDDRPLVLRDGTRAVLVDDAGVIRPMYASDHARVPAGFAWPSYQFLDRVYAITATVEHRDLTIASETVRVLALRDAEVRAVVALAPDVLDGVMRGAWEGTLSRRLGVDQYDEADRVAIRVEFAGFAPAPQVIPRWTPGDGAEAEAWIALGTIVNATAAVRAADGRCLPATASLGDGDPLADSGAAVSMQRMPAMHVPGDYQLVWNGGMGPILPLHPAAAIQDASRDEYLRATSVPHGTPTGMRLSDFRTVTGGGEPCSL